MCDYSKVREYVSKTIREVEDEEEKRLQEKQYEIFQAYIKYLIESEKKALELKRRRTYILSIYTCIKQENVRRSTPMTDMEMIEYREKEMQIITISATNGIDTEDEILRKNWVREHWNDEEFRAYLLI